MARKAPLRAVSEEERAPAPPKTLREAAERSERALLEMMRSKIASEIDGGVPPHTLAPLTRQLRDLDKEIRLLIVREKEQEADGEPAEDEEWDAEAL